jgi:general secretion pathway protein K
MVLVVVCWIIALLAIMATSFSYSLRTETMLATSAVEHARARALAEGGVAYAAMHLSSPVAAEDWSLEGSATEWPMAGATLTISVRGESGKVDLNKAKPELLRALLQSAEVEEDALDALVDAIEDWRDSNDLRGLNGAESDEYRAAGRELGPRNARFESVEELQLVLGMTPEIYQKVAGELTVFSRQEGINPDMASPALLRTLPDIDAVALEQYLQQREDNISQGLPPPEAPFSSPHLSDNRGVAYHVKVEALLDSGAKASVRATIALRNRQNLPYQQLAWREGK